MFPHGAYAVGVVEPVKDFDRSTKERIVQAVDRHTGLPVWQILVMDADPAAKAAQKTVAVKISSATEPQSPPLTPENPIVSVEFDGMTVTPYVHQATGRLAYSLRASSIRPSRTRAGAGS
ncbi:plasmid replication, integration and excision activator [Spongiactinospora rosea]|uniref:plasmid replication, integration and excision activator n=1 Tax=Spongiactinospora rosea TaxID=2248750 RepID=UPI001CED9BE8|nr:plasmid replication, integration and excision activator [Spongiactinospora rosea]